MRDGSTYKEGEGLLELRNLLLRERISLQSVLVSDTPTRVYTSRGMHVLRGGAAVWGGSLGGLSYHSYSLCVDLESLDGLCLGEQVDAEVRKWVKAESGGLQQEQLKCCSLMR